MRQITDHRNQAAARKASLLERVSRARGNYEREASDANYTALFEAENALLRLQLAEMTAERDGWRSLVQRLARRARAVKREQDAAALAG